MIKKLLEKKKDRIIKKWFECILNTYAPDTAKFLQSKNDRFANPVGHITSETVSNVFQAIIEDKDAEELENLLDPLIRVRAVQDHSPSKAVEFVYILKKIIRDEIGEELNDRSIKDLLNFELRIDKTALAAFSVYMKCREKLYSIKLDRAKSSIFYKAYKKKGLVTDEDKDDDELFRVLGQ